MNSDNKLVAAAKRAARHHSRETNLTYQQSLEAIAQQAGRSTWKAFLDKPVAINAEALEAANEPDFSAITPAEHINAVVRYGQHLDALSFRAHTRSQDDHSAVLRYELASGKYHGVDARGLSLDDLALSLKKQNKLSRMPRYYDDVSLHIGTVEIEGVEVRANIRSMTDDYGGIYDICATLDGAMPEDHIFGHIEIPAPYESTQRYGTIMREDEGKHSLPDQIKKGLTKALHGRDGYAVKEMAKNGPVATDNLGPIVAMTKRGVDVRLKHGFNLMAFSPAGTGRMAGITVPALLSDDTASYIVHDDGQLHQITSGHRASLGPVIVIRLDGETRDGFNPFSREWLPPKGDPAPHVEALAVSICDGDSRMTHMVFETAMKLIKQNGETNLKQIHDEIATMRDQPFARKVLMAIHPLVDTIGHAVTGKNTFGPDVLRASKSPSTIYILRDPRKSNGSRNRLASLFQTALWLHYYTWTGKYKALPGKRHLRQINTLIHDYHAMASIPLLPDIMDISRDAGASVILTGATAASLTEKHGKGFDIHMIQASTHMTIVLAQSNRDELEMIDPQHILDWNEVSQLGEGDCIMGSNRVRALARLTLPFFFKRKDLLLRAYNPRRGRGPKPVG